jgi:hypothetical protein
MCGFSRCAGETTHQLKINLISWFVLNISTLQQVALASGETIGAFYSVSLLKKQ